MSDGMGYTALPIRGAAEAIAVLTQVKDDIAEQLPKDARSIARAVASEVQAAFPSEVAYFLPTPTGRGESLIEYDVAAVADVSDSDATVASAGREDEQVPLFRVVVTGRNATYADMGVSAYQETRARVGGIEYLNRAQGPPSRFAWPVAHRARSATNAVLQRHSKRKESDYTKALAKPDR